MTTKAKLVEPWPALPVDAWAETRDTLHMWTQIVGKVRLALAPPLNHWWQVPLYVYPRGLTTSPIPYGELTFEVLFDLLDHNLFVHTSDGQLKAMPLIPRSVAAFYKEFLALLDSLDIHVHIWRMPVEVPNPIPFDEDEEHAAYDAEYASRFLRVLSETDTVLKEFAGRFLGKQSPVHFFWGSFDLAQTRFSGRRAPERAGADKVTREAYSHEVVSFGFWPGAAGMKDALFYAYAAPEPAGFKQARVRPPVASYDASLSEFVFPYEAMRRAASPRTALLEFFQDVYEAGAERGGWDRAELERSWPARRAGLSAEQPHLPEEMV